MTLNDWMRGTYLTKFHDTLCLPKAIPHTCLYK